MITKLNGDYLTNRRWFKDVLRDDDVVLCGVSALECLGMFVGYLREKTIDVYAKKKGIYDNINYRIVNNFDSIETISIDNLLCTSLEQTVNDMMRDFDNTDELALTEALSNYYFENNESFDGLKIDSENLRIFDMLQERAKDYYNSGG